MRIISGKFKGTKLSITENKGTRPLRDLAKESIFNVLQHSKKIQFKLKSAKILDLYSGTGSFGLECLSREADKVIFVENSVTALKVLSKNIDKLKIGEKALVIESSVNKFFKQNKFLINDINLVFMDPPYREKNISDLINDIDSKNLLAEDGIIVIHRNEKTSEIYPKNFKILDVKNYGISKIIFGNLSI